VRSPAPRSLWLLLAAALFVRAFVPAGYMPERADGGMIAVALCGSGEVHLIPRGDGASPDKDRPRVEPPCAFAGLGSPAAPPPALPALAVPAPIAVAYAPAPAPVRAGASTRLLPPATGPPIAA